MWPFSLFRKQSYVPLVVAKSATILSLPGPKLRVTLAEAKYYKEHEFKKLIDAICVVSYVLNSDEFYGRVMLAHFTSTKLSNKQIYERIMQASEGNSEDDYEFDLELEMYLKNNRVIGYTYPSVLRIWQNRKFFTKYTAYEIAGNLVHEGCHKFGFDHVSAQDRQSVPYQIGDIVEEMGKKYLSEALALRPQIEMSIR